MIFRKVRLGLEKGQDSQFGVLILDTEPKGHLIVHFEIEEDAGETLADAQARVEAKAREIMRQAAEADFSWGTPNRC